MMRIAVIDYGSGNLHSAVKALERAAFEGAVRADIRLVESAEEVSRADRVVLPGVGAFADCRAGLDARPGMVEALNEHTLSRARPFLGICVGHQLMAERGEEKTVSPGFGWLKGTVARIEPGSSDLKVPQIGWNVLHCHRPHPLLEGIPLGEEGWHAYFVHSYHLTDAQDSQIVATTDYGGPVTAIAGRDNIIGTQFHPEKSQKLGLRLLSNFLRWSP